MKGSIIIVSFFVVGVLLGRFVDIPNLLTAEEPTLYALYALMFLVGISIGSDKKALEALKHQNFKIVLVPLATIIGPLLVRYFGKLAPISVGGATTADTTLPIITKFCGKEFVIISIVHGITVDLSVPFLVTFFCTI